MVSYPEISIELHVFGTTISPWTTDLFWGLSQCLDLFPDIIKIWSVVLYVACITMIVRTRKRVTEILN